ncbi:hypothetical protein RHDC3_01996 [Rhodocyclaceae bacterium]|nr:hypothetical protein RHDC3_01996 [Rhodocyclaceae bacterium]
MAFHLLGSGSVSAAASAPALAAALLLASPLAQAREIHAPAFDWSLLSGTWAESTEHQFGCRSGNLRFRFVISDDKKLITFKLDRKWKIGNGSEVEEYSALVLEQSSNALVIRYGDELGNLSEAMREWELRFIGPGTYRWRSTKWQADQYNNVIGVKCEL